MRRFFTWLARCWRGGDEKYTVACDRSPFWTPVNTEEKLFRVVGIHTARWKAFRWVRAHPCGQARILDGWHYWPHEQNNEANPTQQNAACNARRASATL